MASLAVLGVGRVGGETAYLSASLGIVDELILYDSSNPMLKAQVLDLEHTALNITIDTDPTLIKEADVCIFSAGFPRNPSIKTRADLLMVNKSVVQECVELLRGFEGVLITVTNPMDVINFLIWKKTHLLRSRCIGFGGQLDSARFALALRQRGITGFAFVLGEHGEHQVPIFSTLSQPISETEREKIVAELRDASMEVIRGKGGTVFGPALHIAHLVRMVLSDKNELAVCSAVLEGEYGISGCSIGVPVRIGKNGIHQIEIWNLDEWERKKMNDAGKYISELCREVES